MTEENKTLLFYQQVSKIYIYSKPFAQVKDIQLIFNNMYLFTYIEIYVT